MSPRILVLHAGGTIGMERSPTGYQPMRDFPSVLRDALQPSAHNRLPAFDVLALKEPIDSANLQPSHWGEIAAALQKHWPQYDGFVVLHGTDTLAWTASALSFQLGGTNKPVVLTGSQIPWIESRTDARSNLEGALQFAAHPALCEVAVFFGQQLLRGNRSSKMSSNQLSAFESPNYPPLGQANIDLQLFNERLLPAAPLEFVLPQFSDDAVAVLSIYPGITASTIDAMRHSGAIRGLILRSYGAGNVPAHNSAWMKALARASADGLVVMNVSQCTRGGVAQGSYQTSAALADMGVVSGSDMTLEATFAKLHFLLATSSDAPRTRAHMASSLRGEITAQP